MQQQQKQTETGNAPGYKLIDFNRVKTQFSLSRFCRDSGLTVRKQQKTTVVECPFHTEDTASCHLFDDRRYTCFGCGAKGTIIDFVLKMRNDLDNSPAKAAMFLIETQGTGRIGDYQMDSTTPPPPASRRKTVPAAAPPAVHALRNDKSKALTYNQDKVIEIGDQIFDQRYARAREYAEARGWLNTPSHVSSYPLGAMMAGEKPSFLAGEPAVAFPKLIQTRRTAQVFGLEKEFEENGRVLCLGFKKRLHPETARQALAYQPATSNTKKRKPMRWMATTGLVTEVPFEFDSNEDAEILVICEGPGDGLRLFNEANANAEAQRQWGNNWHITAVDSCHIWNENSIPRRPVTWGSQNFPVSFFDGFRHVIILLDGDESGRGGVSNIIGLIGRQNPSAIIRDVVLPDGQDVSDFFDSGKTMPDLANIIRATKAIK